MWRKYIYACSPSYLFATRAINEYHLYSHWYFNRGRRHITASFLGRWHQNQNSYRDVGGIRAGLQCFGNLSGRRQLLGPYDLIIAEYVPSNTGNDNHQSGDKTGNAKAFTLYLYMHDHLSNQFNSNVHRLPAGADAESVIWIRLDLDECSGDCSMEAGWRKMIVDW